MKKLLILILFFISLTSYSQIQTIGVGTAPNDGTGDPLRTAFIKVNNNFSYHAGLIALKANLASPTFIGTVILPSTTTIAGNTVPGIVGDTITARIAAARPLGDLSPQWADTTNAPGGIFTYNQAQNLLGGGGGGAATIFKLQFRTDTTAGAPGTGDSILVHTNFIGKHIEVYRGLAGHATESGAEKQLQNTTGVPNVADGFRFNSTTGQIIFRPVFVTNELVVIESTNTIVWTNLSIEGEESGLLTNLRAYWALDEVSGTLVNDSHTGGFNGTTNATVGVAGKIGLAESFLGTSSQRIDFGTTVGNVGTSDFTIACWIYQPTLQGAWTGIFGNWGDYPYFILQTDDTDKLSCLINFTGTTYAIYTNGALSATTWYHIAMVADRDGNLTLYLNGVAQTDVLDISASSAVSITNNNTFSVGSIGNSQPNSYFTGTIDEIYFRLSTTTAEELIVLMPLTYPFTP